ncbi:hypothetical protein [Methylorubrum thiocyanatum]|uniref:hypothetical protein n=1 Tax=Methylorubrum thiocyanatum TaxID=47958 RepID=UPI0035C79EB8
MPARSARLSILIALGLALACSACGRRGSLEPPGAAVSEPAPGTRSGVPASARSLPGSTISVGDRGAAPDPEAVQAGDELSAAAIPAGGDGVPVTTSRGSKRGYRVPREPFILDSIL